MKKTAPLRFIDEHTVVSTKKFYSQAMKYGTEEYKLMRKFKAENPTVTIVVKKIKKNPEKETNKNLTYENMIKYIKTREDAKNLLHEMKLIKEQSSIYANPYRYVLAWFKSTFKVELEANKNLMDQFTKKDSEDDLFEHLFEESSEIAIPAYQA